MSTSQTPTQPPNTRSAAKAAFTHITNVVLDSPNVTSALLEDDIKDDLTYLDSDPSNPIAYCLKKGDKGLIRSFIHFVQHRDEINNPIGDDWLNVTQDEFDLFCCNLTYTRRFSPLANLGSIAVTPNTSTPLSTQL
jgi:hypothetical protein